MANENTYDTKYGAVSVSTDASSNVTTLNLGLDSSKMTVKAKFDDTGSLVLSSTKDFATTVTATPIPGNTFGISLKSDGSIDPLTSDLTANTVEIDDDPTNTYGLASKKHVKATMDEHKADSEAHKTLFNNILKAVTDLYEEKGELHAYKISDDYGNVINANGKCIWDGDTSHPKYLVFSSERNPDIDARFLELSGKIDGKQNKLTVGENLSLTESGSLSVADMHYDDSALVGRVNAMTSKIAQNTSSINALGSRVSTAESSISAVQSGKMDKVKYEGNDVAFVVVSAEPEVKAQNTLYFVLG